jgi:2-polyprenyl-3-methyl-5-hydroxy-6-metoxy-1,4-benzoquinol methylase
MLLQDNGWETSAQAWISEIGEFGDYGRRYILDRPMLERISQKKYQHVLDVGCGEGRFCRILQAQGLNTTGIEPTRTLLQAAAQRDPAGQYVDAVAENLSFENERFDLVISYLTLIDIDDIESAINEMARVLRPGGALLIANLNSFNTAGQWQKHDNGAREFTIDDYLTTRPQQSSWRGISVRNWHRPFSVYAKLLINTGLRLTYFDEPLPVGGDPEKNRHYCRAPYFHMMEWQKS